MLGRPRNRWEDNNILKWILEKQDGIRDWINLAQDRDEWRVLVNMIMNLQSSIKSCEILGWLSNWLFLKKG
jgi:hypothetical protein